jgi:hypothetical protein
MNLTTQTQTNKIPFQGLDAVTGLKEISDGEAAICNGGKFELTTVKCIDKEDGLFDGINGDEIYVKVNGKTVWGISNINERQSLSLESIGSLKGSDKVELWENDPGKGNDALIGSFTPSTVKGRVELNQSGGIYTIGVKNV